MSYKGKWELFAKKSEERRLRVENVLNNSVKKNKSNQVVIREYIRDCRIKFENGVFTLQELDVLEMAIEFIEGGECDIVLFIRICVYFQEYKRASIFISHNIDNDEIDVEGKERIEIMRSHIKYAIGKQKVVQMILSGVTDVGELVKATGVLEVDVIPLLRTTLEDDKTAEVIQLVRPPLFQESR